MQTSNPMRCPARACLHAIFFVAFLAISIVGIGLLSSFPTPYIQDLYVPALMNHLVNETTPLNTSIFIDLEFRRDFALSRPSYADLRMTLFYGSKRRLPVANHTVEGFSMGWRRTVEKKAAVEAPGLPWEDAFRKVSSGSTVALLVELAVQYKLERCAYVPYICSSSNAVAAVVRVDEYGEMVSISY